MNQPTPVDGPGGPPAAEHTLPPVQCPACTAGVVVRVREVDGDRDDRTGPRRATEVGEA